MSVPHAPSPGHQDTAHVPAGESSPVSDGAPRTVPGPSPFDPEGVVFSPVSSRLVTARLVINGIIDAAALVAVVVLGVLVSPWFHVGTALCVLLAAWELWFIPRQVGAMGYALAQEHLLWRKGIMFRTMSLIPYGRMQFVDTSQGPLARFLGIAEVRLHTAAASTDATINGLPVAEAEHLRQILSERGEQRMAGL